MSKRAAKDNAAGDPIRVFLSYRRSDDRHFVGRFHDRLIARYGEANVFMDIDSIHAGSNFSDVIADQVGMVDAVIVMIGATWATRLHQEGDLVRMEVAESIAADCAVVPVLIDDTPLPAVDSLPNDINSLLQLNVARVRGGVDFHRDTTRTLEGLESSVAAARRAAAEKRAAAAQREREAADARRREAAAPASQRSRRRLIVGAGIIAIIAVLGYLIWPSNPPADSAVGTTQATIAAEADTTATSTASPPTTTTSVALQRDALTVLQSDFPRFAALVELDEDSAELLANLDQRVTVFAPSDAALDGVTDALATEEEVASFVRYHIIEQNRTVQELSARSYRTFDGTDIVVNCTLPKEPGSTKQLPCADDHTDSDIFTIDSVVTVVDYGTETSNGRVIEIDAPLWNPSLGERPEAVIDTQPGASTRPTSPDPGTTTSPTTSGATTSTAPPTTVGATNFVFTNVSPNSTTVSVGQEKTIQVTVSWTGAPNGGEYLCIGRSENSVPRDAGGFALAYVVQSGNCSTVGGTNGSGTVSLLIGGNFAGQASYYLYDAEGRASGSKVFTITVV